MHERLKDVFHCHEILIALTRFTERVLQDPLPGLSELVFVRA